MFKNKSLAFSITVSLSLVIIIIFSTMTYYNYVSVKKQVSKLIGEKTALQIKIIADTLQEKFEGINKSTYVLAKTVASFNLDSNEIKKAIRIFLTSRKTIFGSSISLEPYTLGKNIKLFAPYYFRTDTGYRYINLNSNEYNYLAQEWYRVARESGKPTWSAPYFDEGGGNNWMITRSVPIYKKNKKTGDKYFIGVASADVTLTWISNFLNSNKIYKNGYSILVAPDGTLISYPDTSLILKANISELIKKTCNKDLEAVAEKMTSGETGYVKFKSYYNKKDGYLSYSPLNINGWSIGVFVPEKEVFAPLTKHVFDMIKYSIISIFIIILIIIYIVRRLTKPMKLATISAESIALGKIDSGSKLTIKALKTFKLNTENIEEEGRERIKSTKNELYKMMYAFALMTTNINSLLSEVKDSGEKLYDISTKMENMINNLNSTIKEQAGSTEEVSSSSVSINKTAAKLAQTTRNLTGKVTAASLLALEGIKSLEELNQAFEAITETAENLNEKLDDIDRSSKNISKVVTTIMKISNQTNLLSLNASIEAEKAGEFGAGFSVVAKEIRRLADQTAESTYEIEHMITDTNESVEIGVKTVEANYKEIENSYKKLNSISKDIKNIINNIRDIEPEIINISKAMESQLESTEKINKATEKLTNSMDNTEAAIEETIRFRNHLLESIERLKQELSKFSATE